MSSTLQADPANPPCEPLSGVNPGTFAYTTIKDRLPVIVTKIVDDLYRTYNALPDESKEKKTEAKGIISEIGELRYELQRDRELRDIVDDGDADFSVWNDCLHTYFDGKTWFSATWLFAECYLYRRIREIFNLSKLWKNYDPFTRQKESTFMASRTAVIELTKRAESLFQVSENLLEGTFHELVLISLWGNQTDLSLFVNLQAEDIEKLQKANEDAEKYVLANALEPLWNKVKTLKDARIDFVLDNAGFELFGDLILADWLIHKKYASKIHFHCKADPWFVSDTTEMDFMWTIQTCINGFAESQDERLKTLAQRWADYIQSGIWELNSHKFWTSPYAFYHIETQAPDLYDTLSKSSLVIFKGDLNYRKLVYDCAWPSVTPFKTAIGPLATSTGFPALCALRTNKSDVIVGLKEGQAEELDGVASDWMVSGQYAVIQFSEGNQ
ncbi:Hairy/enhancer-of-split with YRPW motif protein 2 [Basidiobolus ranarum]|uniref:Sugar phosphate phosphatase n=1 Tax=Basidiobolus ranarum TaxID=34480 RepID=A0ABR2W9Z2_9FUNG